jgi:hypothetical protein
MWNKLLVISVVLLLGWLPLKSAGEGGDGVASVPLCLGCSIFAEAPSQLGGKSVLNIGYLRNAAAAAMAVRDINTQNCTIYGPGCGEIVSWEGEAAAVRTK